MASSEVAFLSATELLMHYRRRTLSPVEVTRAVLDQINRTNSIVNAYCHVDAEGALKCARESELRWKASSPKGLIDGVPVGIKDSILVANMPARFGSRLTPAEPVPHHSAAVARLCENGAVIIGKTAMPEFGWKPVTDSPLTGVTRNPWNTRMTPGGSSGGAAAAVTLGMGPIQIGTDGGGSIRIPAAFSGCYGIKPTRARVAVWPPSPLGTLVHVGPLTQSVGDAALALCVISAPDPRDPYSWVSDAPDFRLGLDAGVCGLRIAYSLRLGYATRVDSEVEVAVNSAVRIFEELGAHVEEAHPGSGENPISSWATLWWATAAAILQNYWERVDAEGDPDLVNRAARGLRTSAVDYINAQTKRAEISAAFAQFWQRHDLLLTPSLPLAAFEAGHVVPPGNDWGKEWSDWTPFSYPFNLTQQPAASIPCGITREGLPIGLQIVGAIGQETLVLRASKSFETARPSPKLRAPHTTL
jgi:aspartyl-tRNA(Asn)/glutamyl-tRNA(Gln) amidotransferase subunit A